MIRSAATDSLINLLNNAVPKELLIHNKSEIMDAQNMYLTALRYTMSANPTDKSTWSDIFKYINCLRQMLSCCVCGNLMRQPQGPTHSVCLHHVCRACVGGKMKLKPSCSWCKDHETFRDNKHLRVLILCFKNLCGYITRSPLGEEMLKTSINGCGSEVERTKRVLEEVEQFQDNYTLTAPPTDFPSVSKSLAGRRVSNSGNPSFSGHFVNLNLKTSSASGSKSRSVHSDRKRGRPASAKRNSRGQYGPTVKNTIKRIKQKALNQSKSRFIFKNKKVGQLKKQAHSPSPFLAQRPHRDRSGKFSVGQLWRETFLEEIPLKKQDATTHPDSGIDAGTSSEKDDPPSQLSPSTQLTEVKAAETTTQSRSETVRKETRLHPKMSEDDQKGEVSVSAVSSTTDDKPKIKPRLTMTISRKRLQKTSKKSQDQNFISTRDLELRDGSTFHVSTSIPRLKRNNHSKVMKNDPKHPLRKTCRCARFKQPNRLTCFGQKCPCYSEKKACVNCLCNGCKNPLKAQDSAPPLMHILRDSDNLDSSFDRSMPRLSPIPALL